MMMRCALIVSAVAAVLYGTVGLSSNDSNMILVDAGQSRLGADLPIWVLAMIGAGMLLPYCRRVAFGLPSTMDSWSGAGKTCLVAGAGILVFAACAFV